LNWLEGEVALVTGGGSGIGRAVVDRFISEGARVAVIDSVPERVAALREQYGDETLLALHADVTQRAEHQRAIDDTVATFGTLSIFVPNAGLWDGFQDFTSIPPDDLESVYDKLFAVNVRAVIVGARLAIPQLVKTRGSIVMTLSNSSFYPDGGGVIYVATKHAVLGVMRQLAHELAPVVRVNGVAPGATRTDLQSPEELTSPKTDQLSAEERAEAQRASVEAQTPLKLEAQPEDHTGAYLLLASRREGRLLTGVVINTDAGFGIRGLRRVRGGDNLGSAVA
jgi:NAD(P)-dependent dehydrogenase (short-subunit alcohol dehydrogenase family)